MNSDVVITMLPDSPDVEAVINGPDGILAGARPGLIHIDMSTISATATRRIAALEAEHGVIHIDAPVSGGDIGAKNATLTIMVGGDEYAVLAVEPIFKVMGKRITHIGPIGCGQVAKACNQIMVAAQMVAHGRIAGHGAESGRRSRESGRSDQGRRGAMLDAGQQAAAPVRGQSHAGLQGVDAVQRSQHRHGDGPDLRRAPARHGGQHASRSTR